MAATQPSKVAMVTGGARGIGRGCAHALAKAGFALVLVDVLVPEMARTAGEIRALGRDVLTLEADVASFARAQEVAGEARARFGRIDFLLNDAGRSMPKGTFGRSRRSCWRKAVAASPRCRRSMPTPAA